MVAKVAETTGAETGILQKLLPALAPIALSFLSKQLQGKAAAPQPGATTAQGASAPEEGGGLGGLLGGLLGGAGGSGGGLDVGSVLGGLGGLLGGGRR
ncbi:hypothetical protein [Xylanimonas allomyrinae]|uniref:hypothetical protein n=1 Tax=Xylanimonas allomyrinae TaxID=2509459 RepID=UPI002482BBF0|nr:hypothetical protein [Xylanimonas allomyrinae]